jgi:quinone-modifying oxidoreductase subunit QmoC
MAEHSLVEPDVGFVQDLGKLGGQDVKKCYQCATCSVVCPISPDTQPFPRKEMIAAGWGLKDRVLHSADIWLCHNCGDCTTKCPRGAKPGDVLAALRTYAVGEYVKDVKPFQKLAQMVNDPKALPVLLAIPAVIFIVVGLITGLLDFTPEGEEIVHSHFFSTWLVDLIMIPASLFAVAVFGLGLKNFVTRMHENALREGKTDKKELDPAGIARGIFTSIPAILRHDRFNECTENRERSTAHMMVLFGFIGLAIVTSIFFVVLYVFQIHGPYSQLNPVKWLANVSGVALVVGAALMIKQRMAKTDQTSTYKDWFLIGLALALGLTGMLTEMTRLGGMAGLSYFLYFIHLVFVFGLFVYTPFSKLAHLVYRTVAIGYNEWSGRK